MMPDGLLRNKHKATGMRNGFKALSRNLKTWKKNDWCRDSYIPTQGHGRDSWGRSAAWYKKRPSSLIAGGLIIRLHKPHSRGGAPGLARERLGFAIAQRHADSLDKSADENPDPIEAYRQHMAADFYRGVSYGAIGAGASEAISGWKGPDPFRQGIPPIPPIQPFRAAFCSWARRMPTR